MENMENRIRIENAFEKMSRKIKQFITKISTYKRKNPAIDEFAREMIEAVTSIYQELYNLSDEVKKSNPEIRDGKTLKSLLMDLYGQTTLSKMSQFLFLMDLIRVIMTSFINEIKKNESMGLDEIAQEIDEKVLELEKKEATVYDEPLFYTSENGKNILHDNAIEILSQFQKHKVNFSFSGEKLNVNVPMGENAGSLVEDIKSLFGQKFTKSVCKNLSVRAEQTLNSTKVSIPVRNYYDEKSISTGGMIIKTNYCYYVVTCAHCLLDYEEDLDELKQFDLLSKALQRKDYTNGLYLEFDGNSLALDQLVLEGSFLFFDANVDLALIPVPFEYINVTSCYESIYESPENLKFSEIEGPLKIYAKHGQKTQIRFTTLPCSKGENTQAYKDQLVFTSESATFAEKGDSGSCVVCLNRDSENPLDWSFSPMGRIHQIRTKQTEKKKVSVADAFPLKYIFTRIEECPEFPDTIVSIYFFPEKYFSLRMMK